MYKCVLLTFLLKYLFSNINRELVIIGLFKIFTKKKNNNFTAFYLNYLFFVNKTK